MTRYRIKERYTNLGITGVQIIGMMAACGVKCNQQQFTNAIRGRTQRPKDELICETADRILTELEKEEGR